MLVPRKSCARHVTRCLQCAPALNACRWYLTSRETRVHRRIGRVQSIYRISQASPSSVLPLAGKKSIDRSTMSSIARITRRTPALVRAFGTTPARRFPSDTLDKPGKPASMNPSYVLAPCHIHAQLTDFPPAGKTHNRSRRATNPPTISSLIQRNRVKVAQRAHRRLRGARRSRMRPRSRSVIRPRAVTSWIRRDSER